MTGERRVVSKERSPEGAALRDQRGAAFAEYVIVFGTAVLGLLVAFGALAATVQVAYWYKLIFQNIDIIQ